MVTPEQFTIHKINKYSYLVRTAVLNDEIDQRHIRFGLSICLDTEEKGPRLCTAKFVY